MGIVQISNMVGMALSKYSLNLMKRCEFFHTSKVITVFNFQVFFRSVISSAHHEVTKDT